VEAQAEATGQRRKEAHERGGNGLEEERKEGNKIKRKRMEKK